MIRSFHRSAAFAFAVVFVVALSCFAKDQPYRERGVLAEMQSVSCGYQQNTGHTVAGMIITGAEHTRSHELLCQEYVLKTDRVTYRIRPKEEKHPALLRVGDEAEFRLKKDELLLRVPELDNKEREYIVVSMVASSELTAEINGTQHPPKPHTHGTNLQVSDTAADREQAPNTTTPVTDMAQPNPRVPAASQQIASAQPAPAAVSAGSAQADSTLKIESTPPGAEVFVDSARVGQTPALLKVAPGQHSVQVVMAGFKDWVSKVDIAAGTQQRVMANLAR